MSPHRLGTRWHRTRLGPGARPRGLVAAAVALAAVALAVAPGGAHAATYVVTTTADRGPGSLRQALADAQAALGGDAIAFAGSLAGRRITLKAPLVIDDFGGLVTIDGSDAPGLAISGDGRTALLDVRAGDVTIRRLTLRDGVGARGADGGPGPGDAGGNGGGGGGAAIFNRPGATLRLIDAVVAGNVGGDGGDGSYGALAAGGGGGGGGGALVNAGRMAITSSTVVGNVGGYGGDGGDSTRSGGGGGAGAGAITNAPGATLTIVNATIAGNRGGDGGDGGSRPQQTVPGGGGGAGGAALVALAGGTVTVSNTTFLGNVAGAGGRGGPGTSLAANMGAGGGGGPGGGGGGGNNPPCCTSTGGAGPLGDGGAGGLDNAPAPAGIGTGGGGGGGPAGGGGNGGPGGGGGGGNGGHGQGGAGDGGLVAGGGGGGGFGGGEGGSWDRYAGLPGLGDAGALLAAGSVTVTSTALAGSADLDGAAAPDCRGTITAGRANLLQLPTGCARPAGDGLVGDPQLSPLGDHGGPTPTAVPGPGSPVRDAGANPLGLAHDQRGTGFPREIGPPDIGAVEAAAEPALPPDEPVPAPPGPLPPDEPVPAPPGPMAPDAPVPPPAGEPSAPVAPATSDRPRTPPGDAAPRVVVRQRVLRVRAGAVRVHVGCARARAGRGTCDVALTLRRRVGRRVVVVARGRARIAAGRRRLVPLRLTAAGRRLRPARRAGTAVLAIDRRDRAGTRGTVQLRVRLR